MLCVFQPCYQASAGSSRLLEPGASTEQIVEAVNNFYDDFVENCIRENHTYANQMDINDGEVNSKSTSKVT